MQKFCSEKKDNKNRRGTKRLDEDGEIVGAAIITIQVEGEFSSKGIASNFI